MLFFNACEDVADRCVDNSMPAKNSIPRLRIIIIFFQCIFLFFVSTSVVDPMGRFTYLHQHDVLILRAVAYSSSMATADREVIALLALGER